MLVAAPRRMNPITTSQGEPSSWRDSQPEIVKFTIAKDAASPDNVTTRSAWVRGGP